MILNEQKYYVFGLNFRGLLVASRLLDLGKDVAIIDNDQNKRNCDCYRGISCFLPTEVEFDRMVIIAAQKEYNVMSITNQVIELGGKDIYLLNDKDADELIKTTDDESYLRCMWRYDMGYDIDFNNPKTFNEKLNWLKIHDHKDIYTTMVDKYEAKEHVAKKIGREHVIPSIGVWEEFDKIPFEEFPDRFVLKCTHDSGSVYIVKNKNEFNPDLIRDRFQAALSKNYFYDYREWPYKNIKPRIIVEQYMEDGISDTLTVYKLFCFNGTPRIAQVIQNDKQADESIDYVDMNWNILDLRQNFPNSKIHLPVPKTWNQMKHFAELLSKSIPFVRVDFYEINNMAIFSEFTFFSDAGFTKFYPEKWDKVLGDWLII